MGSFQGSLDSDFGFTLDGPRFCSSGTRELAKENYRFVEFSDDDSQHAARNPRPRPRNAEQKNAQQPFQNIIVNGDTKSTLSSDQKRETDQIKTVILDPFNEKINNLTIKSREGWLKKLVQVSVDNYTLVKQPDESVKSVITKHCVQLEADIFGKAKNLIKYQGSCMKTINEIQQCSKQNKPYFDENLANEALQSECADYNHSACDNSTKQEKSTTVALTKEKAIICGFTSALSLHHQNGESRASGEADAALKQDAKCQLACQAVQLSSAKEFQFEKKPDLNCISKLVVISLTQLYKEKRFLNKVGALKYRCLVHVCFLQVLNFFTF